MNKEARITRRDILRAAALAPFALSERNRFADRLKENLIRAELSDLLVTQESLESAAINISNIADATDASGTVLSKYVINNGILCSSHWDNKKGKYTEFKPITDVFSGLIGYTDRGVDLVALPDDKTLVAVGFYPDDNRNFKPFIAVSKDRGSNFEGLKIPPELSGGFFANAQESIVIGQNVLIEHVQAEPNQYILFNTETRDYIIFKEENGRDMPFIDSVFVTPDGTAALVNGTVGISEGDVTTIGEVRIDLKKEELVSVSYDDLQVEYPLDINFYRDEKGNLQEIYVASQWGKKLYVVDWPTQNIETIPFGAFDDPLKEFLGEEGWNAEFWRFQRIGATNVAFDSIETEAPDIPNSRKPLTVFWPKGTSPSDPNNLTFRMINTEGYSYIGLADLKKLKREFVFEEVVAGLGLATIPMTQDGELLGEETLFPNNGLQIEKLLTNSPNVAIAQELPRDLLFQDKRKVFKAKALGFDPQTTRLLSNSE